MFQVNFFSSRAGQDTNLFVVGFQTDQAAHAELGALADAGGGVTFTTTQPHELTDALRQTVTVVSARRAADQASAVAESLPGQREPVAAPASAGSAVWAWLALALGGSSLRASSRQCGYAEGACGEMLADRPCRGGEAPGDAGDATSWL